MTGPAMRKKPLWRFVFGAVLILQALFEFSNIGTTLAIGAGTIDGEAVGATAAQIRYYEDLEIVDHVVGAVYSLLLLITGFLVFLWSPRARDFMIGRVGLHALYFPTHLVTSDYLDALGTPGLVSLGIATVVLLIELFVVLQIHRRTPTEDLGRSVVGEAN
ncbi:hypothetical protein [Parvularcula maris]|uniref:Uncharacterized protein n=1 Tax=Parvularcula maris TaxID=2965077 RepID=A0A9X2RJD9_9PROT|nr:hypothetical protein [Parvularcula maris]MCQ8184637.1 hypothetical protein [Parvularcula maris]